MFHLFESEILSYRNAFIQATLIDPDFWRNLGKAGKWDVVLPLEELQGTLPMFHFQVRGGVAHPDNYFTGANLDLYSTRLVEVMRDHTDFRFELFPAELLVKDTGVCLESEFFVFRLLQTFPLLDAQRCTLRRYALIEAQINEKTQDDAPALFRDETFPHLVFIRNDLKERIEKLDMKGCQFKTLDDYLAGKRTLTAPFD